MSSMVLLPLDLDSVVEVADHPEAVDDVVGNHEAVRDRSPVVIRQWMGQETNHPALGSDRSRTCAGRATGQMTSLNQRPWRRDQMLPAEELLASGDDLTFHDFTSIAATKMVGS